MKTMINPEEEFELTKKEVMISFDKVLYEDTIIKYTGLYSEKDRKRVLRMIDESMKQSTDVGIVIFYDQ